MPKPAGWSDVMLANRDRCVTKLKAAGTPESKAYAVCTAAVEHKTKRGK